MGFALASAGAAVGEKNQKRLICHELTGSGPIAFGDIHQVDVVWRWLRKGGRRYVPVSRQIEEHNKSMAVDRVHPELIEIALDKVEGFAFERFACDFLSSVEGRNFVPLGGVHDGGADGVESRELYESDKAQTFYQFTRQANHRDKIRKTVARLKKFGRSPQVLVYLTTRQVPHIDKEEDLLTEELKIIIRIRDKKYITSHVNDSSGTVASYLNHLSHYTDFLGTIGHRSTSDNSDHVADPSVFVFLQHEVANRLGNRKLIHSITDTLILWALRDTDPDKEKFLTRDQIHACISAAFPWSNSFINRHLNDRLEKLRTRGVQGREIRWYRKEKKFCLPFETRESIKAENVEDEALRIEFLDELKLKASEYFESDDSEYEILSHMALRTIEMVFERQGLMLSHFITDDEETDGPLVVSDCIEKLIVDSHIHTNRIEDYRDCIERLVCSVFYDSSPTQRAFLLHLARTYILLFTLKAEPRIVEYFSSMGSSFNLFVGSDIIVKALSERYLKEGDQVVRNMLKAASSIGMKLNLSSSVLEEVYTHVRNTNYEFVNHFADIEPRVTREIVRYSDKILVRAYFYAKFEGLVSGWKKYIGQFISYKNISTPAGQDEIKRYLASEYGLKVVENDELEAVVDMDKVNDLSRTLLEHDEKENEQLAKNGALLVYGIYGIRKKYHESNNGTAFGYSTWWLTNQTRIQRHTYELVKANFSKYIMRPEFVLNFLSIAPSCEQVRKTYGNIFPSNLGIQLGHRLKEDVFYSVLDKVKEWKDYEPGRVNTLIADLSNQLKSDHFRIYDETIESMEAKLSNLG